MFTGADATAGMGVKKKAKNKSLSHNKPHPLLPLLLDLPTLCQKWQKILGLRDWEVKVRFARHYDLPDGYGAHITFSRAHRTASIKILDPIDYDPSHTNFPEDAEGSLVHELTHLLFALFDEDFGAEMIKREEIAINALEKALLGLSRG